MGVGVGMVGVDGGGSGGKVGVWEAVVVMVVVVDHDCAGIVDVVWHC